MPTLTVPIPPTSARRVGQNTTRNGMADIREVGVTVGERPAEEPRRPFDGRARDERSLLSRSARLDAASPPQIIRGGRT
jgi:hypothetical protein